MLAFSIPVPPIAIAWLALSVIVAFLAFAKGRSFIGWMAACIFFTPFVAVVLFFLPSEKPGATPPPVPRAPSLFRRVVNAAGYRLKESAPTKLASSAASAAHRSLSSFAIRGELDRDIAKTVKRRFGKD